MLCPASSFYTFGLSVTIRCVQGEVGAVHRHFLFLPPPCYGLWWTVQSSGPFPKPLYFLLDCMVPGGYQEGFMEGAGPGLGKREQLHIYFLFLPQRNRRWPWGLEGNFRASWGRMWCCAG